MEKADSLQPVRPLKIIKDHPVVTVLLVIFVVGLAWFTTRSVVGKRAPAVTVSRSEVVQTVAMTGQVAPIASVKIAPLVSGRVTSVNVDEGDTVEQGQVLLSLEKEAFEARVDRAKALVAQARAQSKEVSGSSLTQAKEALVRAQTQFEQAKRVANRAKTLWQEKALSRQEWEAAEEARVLAESNVRTLKAQVADLKSGGAKRTVGLAALQQAKAELAVAELQLHHATVRAPSAGVISARSVEVGDVLSEGRTAMILEVVGAFELIAEPDERNLATLRVGQIALASAEAYPDQTFEATIDSIAPAVDKDKGTIKISFRVPEPPDYLRVAMTVSIDVEVKRSRNAIAVPRDYIFDLATDKPWVKAVQDGKAVKRTVTLGAIGEMLVEVTDGLEEQDVLLRNSADIEIGAKVRPQLK